MASIRLNFGGKCVDVFGGPYVQRPAGMVGVKLAAEVDAPCDIDLPTKDYSVPDVGLATQALSKTIEKMGDGETIYAGCWAGLGRTGLFLALLAKVAGEVDPVAFVRASYNAHAVETAEQKKYVELFPVELLRETYDRASLGAAALANAKPREAPGGKARM